MEPTCSPPCAISYVRSERGRKDREKERRKDTRQRRAALKTRGDHVRDAQSAFNGFIRERDRGQPCISCGTFRPGGDPRGGQWDAGHYRSRGACPELRFTEENVARQCKKCNSFQSGNVQAFRLGLIERIGEDRVKWLEGPHEPLHLTIDDLKEIKRTYRRKTRELKKAGGASTAPSPTAGPSALGGSAETGLN